MENNETKQKEKELIIARLDIVSPELSFYVGGGDKSFSKKDLIEEINKDTDIGKEFIKIQLEFLRAMKDGSLMKVLVA
jgi:hypothetical protein